MKTIRVVVDSRLRIERSPDLVEAVEDLRGEFTHPNPAHEQWSSLAPRFRKYHPEPPRTICTWRDDPRELTLPRGGVERVRGILGARGFGLEVVDERSGGTQAPWAYARSLEHSVTLFPFQEEMVAAALEHQTCILRAPCGGGKTSVGIAVAARVGVSTLVVVPSTRIFDEWVKRLQYELGLAPDDVGWFGRGKKRIRPITVATVDALRRHVAVAAPLFGCVIFDEVHRAPAASYYPAIDALPCKYRIGVSADERRKDRNHSLNYDLFGRVAIDVPQDLLVEQGVVIPVTVRLEPTDFEAPWYVALSNEDKRRPDLYGRLLDEIVADPARTSQAVEGAAEAASTHPTLVFSHRVAHCARMRADILESLARCGSQIRVGVILGDKVYQAESDATVAGLQAGAVRCGVGTYQSIGTGIDLPAVESGIAVTPILANRQNFVQVRDRLCRVDRRPGATKRSATLYVLWDRKVFGDRPLRNALSWCAAGRVQVLSGGEWVDGREYLKSGVEYSLIGGGS